MPSQGTRIDSSENAPITPTNKNRRSRPTSVVILFRSGLQGHRSIERAFESAFSEPTDDIDVVLDYLPRPSTGIKNRIVNLRHTRRLECDVLHIAGDVQYCAAASRAPTTILTILDLSPLRRLRGWRRSLVSLFWYRIPIACSDVVAAISDSVSSELALIAPYAREKLTAVPIGVGSEWFRATDVEGVRPVNAERRSILLVGTAWNKNVERCIEAVATLQSIEVSIVGPLSSERIDLLNAHGISYRNFVGLDDDDLVTLYRESDVLLFPSEYEGFGMPIIEAQAAGLPVIASTAASSPEVAGTGAILADPNDVGSIRAAVTLLLEDAAERERVVEMGHANAAQYRPERVREAYLALYRTLPQDAT